MKTSKRIRILALVTVVLTALLSVSALAVDQNLSGENMPFSERLEYALQGTATGMVMVFAVLGLLWGIISLSRVVFYDIPNKKAAEAAAEKKQAEAVSEAIAPAAAPAPEATPAAQDDGEIVAVITAAIAAMIESGDYGNEFAGGFRVVSFKRSTKGAWNRK